ncbi:hypothetical protein OB08_07815 [Microbacterium sp. HJ5]
MAMTVPAAVIVLLVTAAPVQAASAAEYTYPSAIDPSSITLSTTDGDSTVIKGDKLRVDAAWSVPDGARAGDTFGMTLPAELEAYAGTITLPAADDPSLTAATCTVAGSPSVLTCTLTDYVNGRTSVGGVFWFTASAQKTTTASAVAFAVAGDEVLVEVPGGGIGAVVDKPTPVNQKPSKGAYQTRAGNLCWQVLFGGSHIAGLDEVVVHDVIAAPDQALAEHHNTDGKIRVKYRTPESIYWTSMPFTGGWNSTGTEFTITIAGPFDPSYGYMVSYDTTPSDATTGTRYRNSADVSGIRLTSTYKYTVAGGGNGSGTVPPTPAPDAGAPAAPAPDMTTPIAPTPEPDAPEVPAESAPSSPEADAPEIPEGGAIAPEPGEDQADAAPDAGPQPERVGHGAVRTPAGEATERVGHATTLAETGGGVAWTIPAAGGLVLLLGIAAVASVRRRA